MRRLVKVTSEELGSKPKYGSFSSETEVPWRQLRQSIAMRIGISSDASASLHLLRHDARSLDQRFETADCHHYPWLIEDSFDCIQRGVSTLPPPFEVIQLHPNKPQRLHEDI